MSEYDGLISPVSAGWRRERFEKRKDNMQDAWPRVSEQEKKELIALLIAEVRVSNRTYQ